jgi:hypothetical protein
MPVGDFWISERSNLFFAIANLSLPSLGARGHTGCARRVLTQDIFFREIGGVSQAC